MGRRHDPDRWIRVAGVLLVIGGLLWSAVVLMLGMIFTGLGEEATPAAVSTFLVAFAASIGGIVTGIGVRRRQLWARVAALAFAGAVCALRVGWLVSNLGGDSGDVVRRLLANAALIAPAVAVIVILIATWPSYHVAPPTRPTTEDGPVAGEPSGRAPAQPRESNTS